MLLNSFYLTGYTLMITRYDQFFFIVTRLNCRVFSINNINVKRYEVFMQMCVFFFFSVSLSLSLFHSLSLSVCLSLSYRHFHLLDLNVVRVCKSHHAKVSIGCRFYCCFSILLLFFFAFFQCGLIGLIVTMIVNKLFDSCAPKKGGHKPQFKTKNSSAYQPSRRK